jgi:hypothetical protein
LRRADIHAQPPWPIAPIAIRPYLASERRIALLPASIEGRIGSCFGHRQVMPMLRRHCSRGHSVPALVVLVAFVSACSGADDQAALGEDDSTAGREDTDWRAVGNSPPCPTPSVFFPDDDGDGFGRTSDGVRACEKPPGQWASAGGDCADEESRAHPAQRIYFPEPYMNAFEELTFDYDCNGYEDSDPRQPGGAPSCGVISITECGGSGYISTERYGEGVNVLCGSRSMFTCKPNTLGLLCGPVHALVDEAQRCH